MGRFGSKGIIDFIKFAFRPIKKNGETQARKPCMRRRIIVVESQMGSSALVLAKDEAEANPPHLRNGTC